MYMMNRTSNKVYILTDREWSTIRIQSSHMINYSNVLTDCVYWFPTWRTVLGNRLWQHWKKTGKTSIYIHIRFLEWGFKSINWQLRRLAKGDNVVTLYFSSGSCDVSEHSSISHFIKFTFLIVSRQHSKSMTTSMLLSWCFWHTRFTLTVWHYVYHVSVSVDWIYNTWSSKLLS